MAKRTKMPTDLNQRAKAIVDLATGEREVPNRDEGKNPAAVALGRLGGKVGGKARAKKLTPEQRSEIAKKAASARWSKRHSLALHFLHYNFARPHQSLGKRTTPAMAAGVASYPWSLTQVAGLLDGKVPSN